MTDSYSEHLNENPEQVMVCLLSETRSISKSLLGNKGAELAEMKKLSLPVPPGMILTTEAWKEYRSEQRLTEKLKSQITKKLNAMEGEAGRLFGANSNPLLVSVRSGAPVSMPGMMDSILNLGLNDATVAKLAEQAGDEKFAYDCYQRLIVSLGRLALGVQGDKFKEIFEKNAQKLGLKKNQEIPVIGLKAIVKDYKELIRNNTGKDFPDDVYEELFLAVKAVFDSWFSERAVAYRHAQKLSDEMGTAVIVQSMVFGNMGNNSGTGVVFTRDPSTGQKRLFGEFMLNAQGEDIVSGIRTPEPIDAMREKLPEIYDQLVRACMVLEAHFKDMQDIEFTIEKGRLYLLQTRSGKRTPQAAARIAFDMFKEGIITREEAVRTVRSIPKEELAIRQKDPNAKLQTLTKGLPASPGIATGIAVFDSDDAERLKEEGKNVILVRPKTSPEDIRGIMAAEGVVTAKGGMTSHAAVITRGLAKPCVVGCEEIEVDFEANKFRVKKGETEIASVAKGEVISIDGAEGIVVRGEIPLSVQTLSDYVKELLT
jgi:pyruvate,orthophosphate dikinase